MSRSVLISDKLISAEKCFIRLRLRLLSVCVSVVLRKRPLVWKSHSDRCYNVSVRHTCCVVSDFTPESLCITSVLGVFAKLRKATVSFIMSVRPSAWNNSAPTGQILIQFYVWAFFSKMRRENSSLIKILQKQRVLFMKTFLRIWKCLAELLLEWEIFQVKVVEKIKTHILCSVTFFPRNRAVCEIMWKNMVEPERPQMTI